MSNFLTVNQALDYLRQRVSPTGDIETIPLIEARGRVLAADQIATVNVPPADNSAMDGFALNFADLKEGATLPVSQRIPAGLAPQPLQPGTAARIFTGSEIPANADTVVMQESCSYEESGDSVTIHKAPSDGAGDNVRPMGQDIRSGAVLLRKGQRLRAPELGLLASIGVAQVPVYKRLKVALVSTGDELVDPGTELQPGQIYNSNRYLLAGLLQGLGVDIVDLGCAKDDPAEIEALLRRAAAESDCVFTAGGVSVGEEDHVKPVLAKLGSQEFWKIAIKPGKPLAFGSICDTPFFGLPGNPVSAFVTLVLFARPYLCAQQGGDFCQPRRFTVKAWFEFLHPRKREEYLRASLDIVDGELTATPLGNQSSGVLTSISRAEVLAVVPVGATVAHGEPVEVIALDSLLSY
ncbi:MAG: molybdopterin molybdotransferase MoeA [Porticoccaceae bacterium]|nr:molybdopterin molybdotransferase MoeA [Porticoccaceae bacterium]